MRRGGHVDVLGGVERDDRPHRRREVPRPHPAAEDDALSFDLALVGDDAGDAWRIRGAADAKPEDADTLTHGHTRVERPAGPSRRQTSRG